MSRLKKCHQKVKRVGCKRCEWGDKNVPKVKRAYLLNRQVRVSKGNKCHLENALQQESDTLTSHVFTGLEPATDYDISISISTFDFGQSEWSAPKIAQTKSHSESDLSELAQFKIAMVRI